MMFPRLRFGLLASFLVCTAVNAQSAPSEPQYPSRKHEQSHGGHYQGGHGSSHKGGHYKNPHTDNQYGHHKKS
jgi:hypothetical protein